MRRLGLLLGLVVPLHAAVIGMSVAAKPLTVARVMALPEGQRGPWLGYLQRSQEQMRADHATLEAERVGLKELPPVPKQSGSARSVPLGRPAGFYKSDEARHIAEVIVSFQTPAGGWSKNLDMGGAARVRGQMYATANLAPVVGAADDFDRAADEHWHYVGTLDNDATNTEIHYLAAMSAAWPGHEGDGYRAAAVRGVEYVLRAQYPNGGWPQIWPLEGQYHDAITFNDDAVVESAMVMELAAAGVREGVEDWGFVPAEMRVRAKAAAGKALEVMLAAQVKVNGVLTVWPQQSDPLTLEAVAARNYEPAALSAGESASLMEYLMRLEKPTPEVVKAVNAAAAWFEAHKIMGYEWSGGRSTPGGRKLSAKADAGPIWPRYSSIATGKPVFGDRDKTIHDDVMEISLERRNGYGWYGSSPEKALVEYGEWKRDRK